MSNDSQTKRAVFDLLASLIDRRTQKNLFESQMIEQVEVMDGKVTIHILYPDERPSSERWELEDEIYQRIEKIPAVKDITIDVHMSNSEKSGATKKDNRPAASPEGDNTQPAPKSTQPGSGLPPKKRIPGVANIVAVASGKGGVGKSTVACNLALALSKRGYRIGLLDVDIYGPSLPTLFGVKSEPMVSEGFIRPIEVAGLRLMSLGFLMKDDQPVVWRGPLVGSVVRQFLYEVDWQGTDYLVVDLPPGTGDAQLTLAQSVPIDGVVIVTTPSDLALIDAARGIRMFHTLDVEVLGIIENMSYFVCPECSTIHHIFGKGGGLREAQRLGTKLLGEIPLDGELRYEGDNGHPILLVNENAPASKAFMNLAQTVVHSKPLVKPKT